MRFFAIKFGDVWRCWKCKSAEVAAKRLFGVSLDLCSDSKDLGTRKREAVKSLIQLQSEELSDGGPDIDADLAMIDQWEKEDSNSKYVTAGDLRKALENPTIPDDAVVHVCVDDRSLSFVMNGKKISAGVLGGLIDILY